MRLSSTASWAIELEHVAGEVGRENGGHRLASDAGVLRAGGLSSRGRELASRSDLMAAKPRFELLGPDRADSLPVSGTG
jgi:hypothetical protein